MSQPPNANKETAKKLPPLSKGKAAAAPLSTRGGKSVVLEMLANKMADLNRQQNEEAFIVALSSLEPNPAQPRQIHDDERDEELAQDIKARGVLQPILVRPLKSGRYQIVAGERRYRACGLAGLSEVPVIIKEYNDEQARYASMVENLQRQDLDPLDEGRFYEILNIEENISVREIASYIHRSHKYVQDRLTKYREYLSVQGSTTPAHHNDKSAGSEGSTAANSDENHERNQQLRKLQNSQIKKLTPTKSVFRFKDFLSQAQSRFNELKPAERIELAEQLRDLRQEMELIEQKLTQAGEQSIN